MTNCIFTRRRINVIRFIFLAFVSSFLHSYVTCTRNHQRMITQCIYTHTHTHRCNHYDRSTTRLNNEFLRYFLFYLFFLFLRRLKQKNLTRQRFANETLTVFFDTVNTYILYKEGLWKLLNKTIYHVLPNRKNPKDLKTFVLKAYFASLILRIFREGETVAVVFPTQQYSI